MKEATQPTTTRTPLLGTREAGLGIISSPPPCVVPDRSCDDGLAISAADVGVAGADADTGGNTSAVWQSPPRVKRVTDGSAVLPNLARRSNARRKLCRRQDEEEVDLSSCCLAAAIGCPISSSPVQTAKEIGWATGQDPGQNRRMNKTGSIESLFRMGLDLGQQRFRGAGVV